MNFSRVIVISCIIAIIAVVRIPQVMKNPRADTHLANTRNILEVGKMAYVVSENPQHEFHGAKNYRLQELADLGYLADTIKSPIFISRFGGSKVNYDLTESIVVVDERESTVIFKVNLSVGGRNLLFKEPMPLEGIKRESFTDKYKEELNIKYTVEYFSESILRFFIYMFYLSKYTHRI